MVIIVETKWKDSVSGKLYGGATHQVVDKDLHASQELDDAIAVAKGMTSKHEVAFIQSRDLHKPGSGKATRS